MAKLFISWNAAIIIIAITSAPLVEAAAANLATGDQDGMQDPDQQCDRPPDYNRVVDPKIESVQDQKVESNKIVDPDFKQQREPDYERIIDPGNEPAEDPVGNRIIDPPREAGKNRDCSPSAPNSAETGMTTSSPFPAQNPPFRFPPTCGHSR